MALCVACSVVALSADTNPVPVRAFRSFARGSGARGLPASTVVALHTDREGTVWIATFDGVARVEHGTVERLSPGKDVPTSGPMTSIIDRRGGGVYVAGSNGVYEFNGTQWTFIQTPGELTKIEEDAAGTLIALDRRGGVWARTAGADWKKTSDEIDAHDFRSLAATADGTVLVAGVDGVFRVENGAPGRRYGAALSEPLTTILVASDGRVWVGSENGHLFSRTDVTEWTPAELPDWHDIRVRSMAEDARNRIWVGGDNGQAALGTASTPFAVWTPENGLKAAAVTAIAGDLTGGVWFGFNGAGLQQWYGEAWTHRTFWRVPGDVEAPLTFSVRRTDDGGFIAAVFNRGVWRWDGRTLAAYGREQGITEDVRFAIEPEPGVIWAGTRAGIFEGRNGRFTRTLTLQSGFVSGFFRAPTGQWWAATTADGVFVRDGNRWVPYAALNGALAPFSPNIRDVIWRGRSHELWIAAGRDLVSFPQGVGQPAVRVALPPGISSPNALVERDDELWVGAVGGIAIHDGTAWRVVTEEEGAPGSAVYSLAAAPDGAMWVGGSSGVGRLKDGKWSRYDASNALISEECNTFGLIVRDNGHVLVGTMSGLAEFDPSAPPQPQPPLRVFWRTPEMDPRHVVRVPSSDRRVTLQWTAPWPRPVPIVYRARLREQTDSWGDVLKTPSLRIENLAPGTYTIDVSARLDQASMTEWSAPISATLIVLPQVWETWWARTAAVLLFVAGIAGLVRWRTARLANRARQLEAAVKDALSSAKVLRGLLPICAHCKKVRDDDGYWTRIEDYISRHSEADFSHGYCPDCVEKHYGELRVRDIE